MSSPKMPLQVYILALGTFALGTSEFMMAGILEPLSHALGISIPVAGGMITAFAVGMLVGGPVMAALTIKLPRKATLVAALTVFTLAHVASALTTDVPLIFLLRVVSAIGAATFWAVGMLVAVQGIDTRFSGRAVSIMVGGLTLANVIGIPVGTFAASFGGWQLAFWVVAVIGVIGLVAVIVFVHAPAEKDPTPFFQRLAPEIRVFAQPQLIVALANTAIFEAAAFAAISYVSPILIRLAHLPEDAVGFVMLAFGVSTFVGVTIGGRVGHRGILRTIFVSLTGMLAAAVLMLVSATWAPGFIASFMLFGMAAFSAAGPFNGRVFGLAEGANTLASGVNVSAFNIGNALGPLAGGVAIAAGAGYRSPLVLTIVLVLGAIALNGVSALQYRRARQGSAGARTFGVGSPAERPERSVTALSGAPAAGDGTPETVAVCDVAG